MSPRRIALAALFALAAIGGAASPSVAAEPGPAEVDALLARVEAQAQKATTMAGEFQQKSRVKLFKQEVVSRGRFYFQRPRRIRWEYVDPDRSVLVLDGDKASLKAPGAPVQTFDLARDAVMRTVFEQLLLWLGAGGLDQAKRDYAITQVPGKTPTLLLIPHAGSAIAKAFARIELRFDEQLQLAAIVLAEPSGDEKSIIFAKMQRNGALPKDAFTP